MKLVVNKNAPLGVKEQIKGQIRLLVESGQLSPGQALPAAKEFASMLNVNRNTVSQAYKELAADGFLRVVVGSGTFVNEGRILPNINKLKGIFEEAFQKAHSLGFTNAQTMEYFLTRLITRTMAPQGRKVLVVDCNNEAVDDISKALQNQLGLEAKGVLIQTLENAGDQAVSYLKDIDLVVCGLNHVEEFKRVIPHHHVDLVAVFLKPDVRIMNELHQLPSGSRVGFVCANQRSTETLYKTHPFSTGATLVKIMAGLDNDDGLREVIEKCDVIFATGYIIERLRSLTRPDQRLIQVDLTIEPSNIDLVREKLACLEATA